MISKKSWFADREDRYEPKFIESFNKREPSIQVGKNNGAPYVMTVKTTWIYPDTMWVRGDRILRSILQLQYLIKLIQVRFSMLNLDGSTEELLQDMK
jgi:hypothetical protein